LVFLRWLILVLVVAGVARRVWLEREKLAAYPFPIEWSWLAASACCYLAGLVPCAAFWRSAMRDCGPAPSWPRTLVAYFAGHLGKYVPGKGLVVVIRAGMARDAGVAVAVGAVTCVHETLLMMATGAVVAAVLVLAIDVPNRLVLFGLAAVVGGALTIFALPPVVARWTLFVTRPFGQMPELLADTRPWRTIARGAAMIAVGWLLMGLSFAAVLASMQELRGVSDRLGVAATVCLMTVVVALATVGGFVSLTPGGLGSREWILVETLGPVIGGDTAVIAAVLLRVVWIVAEAVGTGLFWIVDARCKRSNELAH
jgi:hypothetical protein